MDKSSKAMTLKWKVPGDFLNKVFFLALELRYRDDLIVENLYWLGTTAYAQPEKNMDLNGTWQWQVGKKINEMSWKKTIMPSYWALPQHAPEDPQGDPGTQSLRGRAQGAFERCGSPSEDDRGAYGHP